MQPRDSVIRFAVCIDNEGYLASLEPRKIYQVVPDEWADANQQIRIIDESGEDYLYAASKFVVIDLPEAVAKAFE